MISHAGLVIASDREIGLSASSPKIPPWPTRTGADTYQISRGGHCPREGCRTRSRTRRRRRIRPSLLRPRRARWTCRSRAESISSAKKRNTGWPRRKGRKRQRSRRRRRRGRGKRSLCLQKRHRQSRRSGRRHTSNGAEWWRSWATPGHRDTQRHQPCLSCQLLLFLRAKVSSIEVEHGT